MTEKRKTLSIGGDVNKKAPETIGAPIARELNRDARHRHPKTKMHEFGWVELQDKDGNVTERCPIYLTQGHHKELPDDPEGTGKGAVHIFTRHYDQIFREFGESENADAPNFVAMILSNEMTVFETRYEKDKVMALKSQGTRAVVILAPKRGGRDRQVTHYDIITAYLGTKKAGPKIGRLCNATLEASG